MEFGSELGLSAYFLIEVDFLGFRINQSYPVEPRPAFESGCAREGDWNPHLPVSRRSPGVAPPHCRRSLADALNYIGRLPQRGRHQINSLLCFSAGNELYEDLGHAIALCFSELSTYCPCPVEYENLRKLASLTKLSQDAQYKDWNPISSRRQCFQTICSVLLDMQGLDEESSEELIDPNRLINLLVKGILYESCEQYCEDKAIAQSESTTFRFGCLMNDEKFRSSLSLYSWLQSVPWITMVNSFADRSLTVELDKLDQPPIKKKLDREDLAELYRLTRRCQSRAEKTHELQ
ncbi:WD repeat-containing protein 47 [Caerostris extrusa]|uniref:WD repeat-containing protein 47 n=1 Tax=Caerostris extrusa TaxID=172846 RepID=A0AAV4W1C4_CAEEX|nr:WD repeat-containing protein 47 [Caerostris extrusa]